MSLQINPPDQNCTPEFAVLELRKNQQMQLSRSEIKNMALEQRIKALSAQIEAMTEAMVQVQIDLKNAKDQLQEFIEFTTRYFEAEDHARMVSAGEDRVAQLKAFDRLSVAETILRSRLEQYHFLNGGVE